MKQDGWYAPRSYPHFDLPLPFEAARAYVIDADRVCVTGFIRFSASISSGDVIAQTATAWRFPPSVVLLHHPRTSMVIYSPTMPRFSASATRARLLSMN